MYIYICICICSYRRVFDEKFPRIRTRHWLKTVVSKFKLPGTPMVFRYIQTMMFIIKLKSPRLLLDIYLLGTQWRSGLHMHCSKSICFHGYTQALVLMFKHLFWLFRVLFCVIKLSCWLLNFLVVNAELSFLLHRLLILMFYFLLIQPSYRKFPI